MASPSLLVLGGTRFVGRALVEQALAQGLRVSLFNRGVTAPHLFPEAEHLRGDRLSSLEGLRGRTWDVVVDVAAYDPRAVELSVDALRGRVGRYVFVSTVSVYADHSIPQVEGAPLETDAGSYGGRKAACETIIAEAVRDQALIVRPGLIVGPHDTTDRFAYWPRRVARGGVVLAPGAPDDALQFVDARDLGTWLLRAAADGQRGVFNVTGEQIRFDTLLAACCQVTGTSPELVWVPTDQLLAAGVDPWMGVPLWIAVPGWEAANEVDTSRALAAGLGFRPLVDTLRDTYEWDRSRPRREELLSPEGEKELLEAVRRQSETPE